MPTTELTTYVVDHVSSWEIARDSEHKARWEEFYRLWRGIWIASDQNRQSERSRAIMPGIMHAVDTTVADEIEALLSRGRWFDVSDPSRTQARMVADALLSRVEGLEGPLEEILINGAVFGTGIGKIVISDARRGRVQIDTQPLLPTEFVIDPAAATIPEAWGVAHRLYLPKAVVERRMASGIYEQVSEIGETDPSQIRTWAGEQAPRDTAVIDLIEWHGLVPADMLEGKVPEEAIGDDNLVEAVVTVVNESHELRAVANPYTTRGFDAFQHDRIPRRFWGRGAAEKAYWPQKVLDSEVRARTDALGFSNQPMIAVNNNMIPRGERFGVRPGRNIFLNGDVDKGIKEVQFPGPDPRTFDQQAAMERFIEQSTGIPGSPLQDVSMHNAPGMGVGLLFGPAIRRQRRTLANIERQFLIPHLEKYHERWQALDPSYPIGPLEVEWSSAMGMMAREVEMESLSALVSGLPEGPAKLALIKLIVSNSALEEREMVIAALNLQGQQMLQAMGQPSPSDQARLISAEARQTEVQLKGQIAQLHAQIEGLKQSQLDQERKRDHERKLMELSYRGDKLDAEIENLKSQGIKNIADAEAAEAGPQLELYRAMLDTLSAARAPAQSGPEGPQGAPGASIDPATIEAAVRAAIAPLLERGGRQEGPVQVMRNEQGQVTHVDNRPVIRDQSGRIMGLE